MKEFFEDLSHMCSSSNTLSRGFYIFVTIALVLLTLGVVGGAGAVVYTLIKGWFQIYYALLLLGALVAEAGIIIWLVKSE